MSPHLGIQVGLVVQVHQKQFETRVATLNSLDQYVAKNRLDVDLSRITSLIVTLSACRSVSRSCG